MKTVYDGWKSGEDSYVLYECIILGEGKPADDEVRHVVATIK